jgi:hypothetical protein
MSALNLIRIKFSKKKEKRKNNLTNHSYWTSHGVGSQKIQQEKERKRKKGLAVARAESGDGRCGRKSYLWRF